MPFLPILLSKIKLNHVSELGLGVTCWVGWVCVGGVSSLVLFIRSVRRQYLGNGLSDLLGNCCAKSGQWGLLAHQF